MSQISTVYKCFIACFIFNKFIDCLHKMLLSIFPFIRWLWRLLNYMLLWTHKLESWEILPRHLLIPHIGHMDVTFTLYCFITWSDIRFHFSLHSDLRALSRRFPDTANLILLALRTWHQILVSTPCKHYRNADTFVLSIERLEQSRKHL